MVTASRGFDGACDVTGSESPAGDVPAPGVGGVKYVRCTLDVLSLSLPLTPVSEVPLISYIVKELLLHFPTENF